MKGYEEPLYSDEEILNEFLDNWSEINVKNMTLEQYTDINNKYTFTQWVENRTISLGSIRGRIGSAKFGIYKRKSEKSEKNLFSNDSYSWIKYYGESNYDENEVFEKVKVELITIIKYAQELDFDSIAKSKGFYEIYKWKLAFLYSNQSMIPVFNQGLLRKFTGELGMKHSKNIEYAKMHRFLFDQKPPNISVFNFMRKLFHDAGLLNNRKRGREGTNDLNTDDQIRKGIKETIVTQQHKKFQLKLMQYLKIKYPKATITFEKNFIDLLLVLNNEVHYYEVKTSQTPEACIKNGLGQLISYSYYEEQVLKNYKGFKKKIFILGQWRANTNDLKFIEYVNNSLNVNFEYLSLEELE